MIDPLLICDLHIFHFRNFSIAQTKDDEGVLHKWGHFLHKLSKMPPKSFRSPGGILSSVIPQWICIVFPELSLLLPSGHPVLKYHFRILRGYRSR